MEKKVIGRRGLSRASSAGAQTVSSTMLELPPEMGAGGSPSSLAAASGDGVKGRRPRSAESTKAAVTGKRRIAGGALVPAARTERKQTAKKPPKKPSDVDSWADKRHPTAPDRNAVEKRTAPQLSQTMPLPSKLVTESADALSLGGEGSGNSENEEKSVRRKVFMTAVEGLSEEERDARHEAFTLSDEQRLSDLDIFIQREKEQQEMREGLKNYIRSLHEDSVDGSPRIDFPSTYSSMIESAMEESRSSARAAADASSTSRVETDLGSFDPETLDGDLAALSKKKAGPRGAQQGLRRDPLSVLRSALQTSAAIDDDNEGVHRLANRKTVSLKEIDAQAAKEFETQKARLRPQERDFERLKQSLIQAAASATTSSSEQQFSSSPPRGSPPSSASSSLSSYIRKANEVAQDLSSAVKGIELRETTPSTAEERMTGPSSDDASADGKDTGKARYDSLVLRLIDLEKEDDEEDEDRPCLMGDAREQFSSRAQRLVSSRASISQELTSFVEGLREKVDEEGQPLVDFPEDFSEKVNAVRDSLEIEDSAFAWKMVEGLFQTQFDNGDRNSATPRSPKQGRRASEASSDARQRTPGDPRLADGLQKIHQLDSLLAERVRKDKAVKLDIERSRPSTAVESDKEDEESTVVTSGEKQRKASVRQSPTASSDEDEVVRRKREVRSSLLELEKKARRLSEASVRRALKATSRLFSPLPTMTEDGDASANSIEKRNREMGPLSRYFLLTEEQEKQINAILAREYEEEEVEVEENGTVSSQKGKRGATKVKTETTVVVPMGDGYLPTDEEMSKVGEIDKQLEKISSIRFEAEERARKGSEVSTITLESCRSSMSVGLEGRHSPYTLLTARSSNMTDTGRRREKRLPHDDTTTKGGKMDFLRAMRYEKEEKTRLEDINDRLRQNATASPSAEILPRSTLDALIAQYKWEKGVEEELTDTEKALAARWQEYRQEQEAIEAKQESEKQEKREKRQKLKDQMAERARRRRIEKEGFKDSDR